MCDFNEKVQSDELSDVMYKGFGFDDESDVHVKILLTPKRFISAVYRGDQMISCKGVSAKVEPIELDQLKVTLCLGTQLFFDRNAPQVEYLEDDEDVKL
ncbi:hypothetical protein D3C76_613270 [compost metagenome]